MRKLLATLAALAALGLIAGTALASDGHGGNGWYLHPSNPIHHGHGTCSQDDGFGATGPTGHHDRCDGHRPGHGRHGHGSGTELAHQYTGEGHSVCSEDPAKPIWAVHYTSDAAWISAGSKDGEWIAGACPDVTPPDNGGGGDGTPPPVVIQPTIEAPSHTFLCYSTFEVDPAVYTFDLAWRLLTSPSDHYFTPYAVEGNVQYGTNVGGYHLICNAGLLPHTPGTLGMYTDSDGQVFDQAWADAMASDHGSYNGMTLNVFPVVG